MLGENKILFWVNCMDIFRHNAVVTLRSVIIIIINWSSKKTLSKMILEETVEETMAAFAL